eukprot:Em0005g132a
MRGGKQVSLSPSSRRSFHCNVGKEDALVTKNMIPGDSVYGEKRIAIETVQQTQNEKLKIEYRVWNPFRSKLAAAILGGVDKIHMKPGSKVLYLGAAIGNYRVPCVGPRWTGGTRVCYGTSSAQVPQLIGMVDVVFSDVAQPDQARILALNCHMFLKNQGHFVISIKANCIDSTAEPSSCFCRRDQKAAVREAKASGTANFGTI